MLAALRCPGESLQVSRGCLQALVTSVSLSCLSKVTQLISYYSGLIFRSGKDYVMDQRRTVDAVGAVLCQHHKGEPTAPVDLVSCVILYHNLLLKLRNPRC